MLNCIIVDDEQPSINVITSYIKKTPYLNLVTTTTDALEGIDIVMSQPIDLIFLDVYMPNITGIEFIKAINGKSKVILISAFKQYAVDGFELDVIDYLLKPVTLSRFLKAAKKANDLLSIKEIQPINLPIVVDNFDKNCKKYALTIREIEIVKLLKEGHTYKEIGQNLFIAERTVTTHAEKIFKKTQASNKIELLKKLTS